MGRYQTFLSSIFLLVLTSNLALGSELYPRRRSCDRALRGRVSWQVQVFRGAFWTGVAAVGLYSLSSRVKGTSMRPAIQNGDHVLCLPALLEVDRGDIVVFECPADKGVQYIKRVVGLPGDRLAVMGGSVSLNGVVVEASRRLLEVDPLYVPETVQVGHSEDGSAQAQKENSPGWTLWSEFYFDGIIPEGKVFVMGDNRDHSSDSRNFGFVDRNSLFFANYRVWPLSESGRLPDFEASNDE